MAVNSQFLALDFGAESGRALLGTINDDVLTLEEVHRFPNLPVKTLGTLSWDILRLFGEIKTSIKLALAKTGGKLDGIGVDTWAVDFGLIGKDGKLLGNPTHYRDDRTNGMMEEAFKIVPKAEIYAKTGIQFLQFNTLYQLLAMVKNDADALKICDTLLFIPDIFNYWLTGVKTAEFSLATTSQFYNPHTKSWDKELLEKFDIPTNILPEIVKPGIVIGTLDKSITDELGCGENIPVIAPATHDTGSAVAAVPAVGSDHIYISSGTWSLLGVELKEPLTNGEALDAEFTNEGGVGDTFRFLHNIMGLWIVQECRRTWLAEGCDLNYTEITQLAAEAKGFDSLIDPNDPMFLPPGNMPKRVCDYCEKTGLKVPQTKGEIIRCVLLSLAHSYKNTAEKLDKLFDKHFDPIHIVGGGTQNKLLSQLTADVTGRTVITGPIEATAIGNILVQAMGRGFVKDLNEVRKIVRNSFETLTFEPRK